MESSPGPKPEKGEPFDPNEQRIFDTITGPNLRARDNWIQGLSVLGGLIGGALVAPAVGFFQGNRGDDLIGWALAGGFGGVLLSLLLSGTIIGIVRGARAVNRTRD